MLERFQSVDRFVSGAAMPESAEHIEWLRKQGFKAIVSLEAMPFKAEQAAKKAGITVLHLPLDDAMPPTKREVHSFLRFVNARVKQKKKVFVHCTHGVGRTREMLAFYLVGKGVSPLQAHSIVGSVETQYQKEFLLKYGERLSAALKKVKVRRKPGAVKPRPRMPRK